MGEFDTIEEAEDKQKEYYSKYKYKEFPIHKNKRGKYAIRSMTRKEFEKYQNSISFILEDVLNAEIKTFQTHVYRRKT